MYDNRPLILIVDDIPLNLQVLGNALRKFDCRIAAATSGEKALEILGDVKPDLVILDIMMPGLSGLEVCQRIKCSEKTKDIPIIFLSAKSEIENVIEGFNLGAIDYITKPINTSEILTRVNTHITMSAQNKKIDELHNIINRSTKTISDLILEDRLTGVYNQRGFIMLVNQHIKLAKRLNKNFILLRVTIDNLSEINEEFGNDEKSLTLKNVADVLTGTFREVDIIARHGETDFVVMAIESGEKQINLLINRIHEKLNFINKQLDRSYTISVSYGAISFEKYNECDLDELLLLTDESKLKKN